MSDFEKKLESLKTTKVEVDRFKQSLRRDLLSEMEHRRAPRLRMLAGLATSAAAALAVVLVAFVVRPDLPARLHAAFAGGAPEAATGGAQTTDVASLDDLLERADASAQRDRDYLELFYEQQSSALSVRKVQAERFFTIRQFELSNGEKVAVLTDLGAPGRPRQVQDVTTVARTF